MDRPTMSRIQMKRVRGRGGAPKGFTLVELLVVLAILGYLAAVSLPYMRDIGKGSAVKSAMHQLVQDLAYARQRAISDRANVYVVFLPAMANWNLAPLPANQMQIATNLLAGQYRAYAIVATRRAGDQPGQGRFRYIADWKFLPDGVFIPPVKFDQRWQMYFQLLNETRDNVVITGFTWVSGIKFPTSSGIPLTLPAVGFDPEGRLITGREGDDEFIPLCTGSVWPARNEEGALIPGPVDVMENPPGNWTNAYTFIRIDWLTGRARIERPVVK